MTTIDFTDADVQKCPFGAYRRLREERCPIYVDPKTGIYQINDYALVRQAAMHADVSSSQTGSLLRGTNKTGEQGDRIREIFATHGVLPTEALIATDPPLHRLHRALVDRAFTTVRVRQMEAYLEEIVGGLIDRLEEGGEIEFVAEFALMVPMLVIADQIGVSRSDVTAFKRWSDAAVEAVNPHNTPEQEIELALTLCEMQRYLIAKAGEYRTQPAECMLSDLVHADVDGRKLDDRELAAIVLQLLVAGNETTTNTLANGMIRLIRTPELQQRLRGDPRLIANFTEEVLRIESPIQGLFRRARADLEIGGTTIPAGSMMFLRWGAANHDAQQFSDPERFDVDRDNAKRHLAFGVGAHHCIGNQLARSELNIAFTRLIERLDGFRFTRGEHSVVRSGSYIAYGVAKLYMTADRRPLLGAAA